jgi:hypothetical protein
VQAWRLPVFNEFALCGKSFGKCELLLNSFRP